MCLWTVKIVHEKIFSVSLLENESSGQSGCVKVAGAYACSFDENVSIEIHFIVYRVARLLTFSLNNYRFQAEWIINSPKFDRLRWFGTDLGVTAVKYGAHIYVSGSWVECQNTYIVIKIGRFVDKLGLILFVDLLTVAVSGLCDWKRSLRAVLKIKSRVFLSHSIILNLIMCTNAQWTNIEIDKILSTTAKGFNCSSFFVCVNDIY